MAKPKAFYTYLENETKLNKLSDEQAGRLYKALCAYSRTGERPDFSDDPLLDYAFEDFVIDIDRDQERYEETSKRRAEAGRKGGQANQANASFAKQNQANASFASNEQAKSSKSSEAEAEAEADIPKGMKRKNEKEKYGVFENVLLTKEEFAKLKEAYSDYLDRINRLSEYIASSGKTYKSHYATILSWARKDKTEGKSPPGRKSGVYSADGASFDLEKYEKAGLFND